MNNSTLKEKYFDKAITGLVIILFAFISFLLVSLLLPSKNENNSNVPTLDKTRLLRIVDLVNSRRDVDTGGKPDITKFDYGNEEPFR